MEKLRLPGWEVMEFKTATNLKKEKRRKGLLLSGMMDRG